MVSLIKQFVKINKISNRKINIKKIVNLFKKSIKIKKKNMKKKIC